MITGYIKGYNGQALTIVAPFSNDYLMQKKNITQCEIRLDDGRSISADQRKRIYATLRDISDYTGHIPEETKALMKYAFIAETGAHEFSLSNTDMTTANEFLNFLIEFCILWDVPCMGNLSERSPDIGKYLYICLVHKKCAVCGRKAELHHVDAIGMGRDRKEIVHEGMSVLPLCRIHHTEAHQMGKISFNNKYHLYGICLDKYLCEVLGVKKHD